MAYHTADAREEFDRWSRRYDGDLLQHFFFKPSHRLALAALQPTDRRILDVGCGTCLFARRLLKRFPASDVWGLDLSGGMLARARNCPELAQGDLHLVQADSERLPFADSTFDAITCMHSFHHYPNQQRVLREMHRVVRPDGLVVIIDGDRDRPWGRLIFDVLVVMVEGEVRHVSSRAFRQLYREAGFDRITQRRRRGPFPFLLTSGRAVKPGLQGAPRQVA